MPTVVSFGVGVGVGVGLPGLLGTRPPFRAMRPPGLRADAAPRPRGGLARTFMKPQSAGDDQGRLSVPGGHLTAAGRGTCHDRARAWRGDAVRTSNPAPPMKTLSAVSGEGPPGGSVGSPSAGFSVLASNGSGREVSDLTVGTRPTACSCPPATPIPVSVDSRGRPVCRVGSLRCALNRLGHWRMLVRVVEVGPVGRVLAVAASVVLASWALARTGCGSRCRRRAEEP